MVSWLFCFLSFTSSGIWQVFTPRMSRKCYKRLATSSVLCYHSQKVVNLWPFHRPIRLLDSNITACLRPKNQIKYNISNISYLMTVEIVILMSDFPSRLVSEQTSFESKSVNDVVPMGLWKNLKRTRNQKVMASTLNSTTIFLSFHG